MSADKNALKQRLMGEAALFLTLFFVGLVLMPIAIYVVGTQIFGEYGGSGYGDFFGTLSERIRSGDRVTWFLVASPYIAVLALRLTAWGWRSTAKA